MNTVETFALTKRYGSLNAVDNFNMHVAQGDIYGFVGRNGAGKSTVMKMISGLTQPTSGDIKLFGRNQRGRSAQRVGVLIENPGIYPYLSAYENMMLKALVLGLPNPKKTCNELLDFVSLNTIGSRQSRNFSMGMKQRLGLSLALLGDPDLLLLDEPLNGLDPEGAREVRELIMRLNSERKITVIISSHILEQLGRMATRYGVIRQGSMVRELTAAEVDKECSDYLVMKAAEPNRALAYLQERFSSITYHAMPDSSVHIYGNINATQIGQALSEGGMIVQELYTHKSDLEEYFVRLMGGDRHV